MSEDKKYTEFIYANLHISFADGQMTSEWYTGKRPLYWVRIESHQLNVIHKNAFNAAAFHKLTFFGLHIMHGGAGVKVQAGALAGFHFLTAIEVETNRVENLPTCLFDSIAVSVWDIKYTHWPSDASLNDIFADEVFRNLVTLQIENVQQPQTKFRYLTASNFTFTRRLNMLSLVNCGIEVIERCAFDAIGRLLTTINLSQNRIKSIDIDMFRIMMETKRSIHIQIQSNALLECACNVIEVELSQYPSLNSKHRLIECTPNDKHTINACEPYQRINPLRFCIRWWPMGQLRFINVRIKRMSDDSNAIVIQSNFTSKMRVLLIDFDAMQEKCSDRFARTRFKCFIVDRHTGQLQLDEIEGVREAKTISITIIPILSFRGACPFHSVAIRLVKEATPWDWFNEYKWLLLDIWVIFMGSVIGCGCSIAIAIVWQRYHNHEQIKGNNNASKEKTGHDLSPYYICYHESETIEYADPDFDEGYLTLF